ncbi:hypothetical protein [Marinisporobacter balticus]|uniref:Uncharacterized protein n=1 Tax=Marinisporobacter balticus TaxID=2018667 RepID=A0A4R2L5U3_9FIRM|nr:hypothetical protein [Marinisporobacter balticus]TCO79419.1 hypothetical protein EV214_102138 [Marinisporobacter balticus]
MIKNIMLLVKNYSGVIIALCTLCTLIGGIIVFFVKRVTEKKYKVKQENDELKKKIKKLEEELSNSEYIRNVEDNIQGSPLGGTCLYLADRNIYICTVCWNRNKEIITVFETDDTGYYKCSSCQLESVFDKGKVEHIRNINNKMWSSVYDD